ncbi:MAG: L,D-transpeptidase [Solirubrobacterales bacterium]
MKRTRALRSAGGLGLTLALTIASGALGQEAAPAPAPAATPVEDAVDRGPLPPEPAQVTIKTYNASNRTVDLNEKVHALARIKPFVAGEVMQIRFSHGGKVIKRKNMRVKQMGHRNVGKVTLNSKKILDPGKYRAVALHKGSPNQQADHAKSPQFHPVFPDLDPGNRNSNVRLFNKLLDKEGYFTSHGSKYNDGTARAVMAFRKVNNKSRSFNASPEIFKTLADGKGGFRLKYPGAGHHVEVDISRQVMVLADNGEAKHIFHVSTGAPSTPSDRGTFRFYSKDPGYNSLGMYYSVYYNRGEATHGYHSVPPYNASHGCIRNPIPNSVFIYNWISLGNTMHVYS